MSALASASLGAVPQEVLEHIALFVATENFLGPPSALVPILATNRRINYYLSIVSNQHFYARLFAYKFDVGPVIRRLGSDRTTPRVLSHELQRRCLYLKRIRARVDSIVNPFPIATYEEGTLSGVLWVAYLMMLENDGKNEQQLRDYAKIDDWLREYWFDDHGASFAKMAIRVDQWPPNSEQTSLAMWLFWFLLKPDEYLKEDNASWNAMNVLKILALAAHKYNLTSPSWVDFVPDSRPESTHNVIHYFETLHLNPPPLAVPAILSFLTLSQMAHGVGYSTPLTPSDSPSVATESREWECEWGRCISLGRVEFDKIFADSFRPGSIEGVWEGLFTYTEFTAYTALLSGAPPPILQKSIVARHCQTWKLREHHLLATNTSCSDFEIKVDSHSVDPLPAGDPLRSYFPTGTHITEHGDGIEIWEPGSKEVLHYQRASVTDMQSNCDQINKPAIQDVIITGEGHSAWGQFNLVGRVRPCDGFISLSKEYVDGDRGKWLYRGYLVGNVNGNLAGRWRDTLSPTEVPGYEGCFTMSRRR